jgi:hypothetical protein
MDYYEVQLIIGGICLVFCLFMVLLALWGGE